MERISKGEVSIREFTFEDIADKVRWINDPLNNKYLHYDLPLELEKTQAWYVHKDNRVRQDCVIEYQRGGGVGLIGLLGINRKEQAAEFYICMGEQAYKNKGIATAATRLILEYAFNELGLNKIELATDADNEVACHLYEKIGFKYESEYQEEFTGRLVQRKRYVILKKDWR